MLPDANKWMDE